VGWKYDGTAPPSASFENWKLHSTGVDWITVTATAPSARRRLATVAHRIGGIEQHAGNERLPARVRDYIGWRCGGVVVGERRDSLLCQVSGYTASQHWRRLLVGAHRATRLDVQVTALSPHKRRDEANDAFERIEADERLVRRAGWHSRITTRPTGSTLYIGAPTSERRLRLYDKHAEDPDAYPAGAWRYEVQARGGLARSLAAHLASGDGGRFAGVATVHQCFSARGVQPRFRAGGGGVLGTIPRSRSTDERALRWLDAQVRPTIVRLVGNGYGATLRSIFGLD
jgi:hypothetical protein